VDWGAAAALLNEVAIGLAASAGEGTDFAVLSRIIIAIIVWGRVNLLMLSSFDDRKN